MTVTYATGSEPGYGGWFYSGQQKPMIRIMNHYLLSAGFHVGDSIEVLYGNGTITITKVDTLLNNTNIQ